MSYQITLNFTDAGVVAWWGAIIATIVLIWDIYKWKTSGAKLRVTVSPHRVILNDPPREGNIYISIDIENIGDRPTTLQGIYLRHYMDFIKKVVRRTSKQGYINADTNFPLPYVINPGTTWMGLVIQKKEIEDMSRQGYLYFDLKHSQNRRAKKMRIRITE